MSVYNPIENDDYTLRPAIEPPPPDKLTAALCAMLQDVLTFTRTPSFGRVRVQGEADLKPNITLGDDEVLIVVSEAVQEPVDLGGTKGTLGVRRTKRITWNLHAVISSVQQPRAQRSRVAQNIALYVERAIAANGFLPDPEGVKLLYCPLVFADHGLQVWQYGYIAPGVPMQWRSREIIVTAPLVTYWMATDMAGVGSGY
jgi:hypothetical protein